MPQRGQQCLPDCGIVRRQRAELAVVPAEILEVGHQFADVVDIGDDPDQCADQTVPLPGHRRREHVPGFRVLQEQVAVEVQRDVVAAMRRDGREVVLECLGVERHDRPQALTMADRNGDSASTTAPMVCASAPAACKVCAEMPDDLVERRVGDVQTVVCLAPCPARCTSGSAGGCHQHCPSGDGARKSCRPRRSTEPDRDLRRPARRRRPPHS